jgi:integrase
MSVGLGKSCLTRLNPRKAIWVELLTTFTLDASRIHVISVPDGLYALLLRHEAAQQAEREHAGTEWHEGGWMFTQPTGKPIDPRRDLADWKSILEEAGVRDARLHDARHTAATVLLLLGVNDRVVMEVMGWSNSEHEAAVHARDGGTTEGRSAPD